MPDTPAAPDWEAYVTAMTPVTGLPLTDASRTRVADTLAMLAAAAGLYIDFPLDDVIDEAAPVFSPGPAPDRTP
jgi:Protein of unknown function (DUF4089)